MSDRRRFRRPPGIHRPPPRPAPETPEEVLELAPDVSRETPPPVFLDDLSRYVAGGQVPEPHSDAAADELVGRLAAAELEDPPPLRRDQVIRLEALTALWARDVRIGGPGPDDTLLYASPAKPPPPPPRRVAVDQLVDEHVDQAPATLPAELQPAQRYQPDRPQRFDLPPVPDEAAVLERSHQLEEAEEDHQPPAPAPAPGPDQPGPARRVNAWVSRHDPRSLEYPIRSRLERAVPLQDVSLEAGPVLDQGTTPPLSLRAASACTGMAAAVAANVLYLGPNRGDSRAGWGVAREEEARHAYELAQDLDQRSGHDYAGTSVLAVMKAGQELGWWGGYLWALGGTKDVAQVLLQLRVAVVVGVPWSADLEEPDRYGVIRPGGDDRGGHCLAVVGLRLGMLGGRPGPYFELQQSRGPAEGVGGRVYLHHSQLARLLGGVGEAGVPLPAELLQ